MRKFAISILVVTFHQITLFISWSIYYGIFDTGDYWGITGIAGTCMLDYPTNKSNKCRSFL